MEAESKTSLWVVTPCAGERRGAFLMCYLCDNINPSLFSAAQPLWKTVPWLVSIVVITSTSLAVGAVESHPQMETF